MTTLREVARETELIYIRLFAIEPFLIQGLVSHMLIIRCRGIK